MSERRVCRERAHERSPGEFARGEGADDAIRRRIERLYICYVSANLPRKKIPNFLVEIGSSDLRRIWRGLCMAGSRDAKQRAASGRDYREDVEFCSADDRII